MKKAIKGAAAIVLTIGVMISVVAITIIGGADSRETIEEFNRQFLFGALVLGISIVATFIASLVVGMLDEKETDYDF